MENRRSFSGMLSTFFAVVLVFMAFGSGVVVGWITPSIKAQVAASTNLPIFIDKTVKPDGMDNLFKPFWESWNLVHQEYIDQPVNNISLMRGAITGMVASLGDQHTAYMNPTDFIVQENYLQGGQYQGIGVWVDTKGDLLTIISPIKGSPAEKADLKAGDVILAVDGTDVHGLDPETVMGKIKGPVGTAVRLTIGRIGVDKPFDVTIKRAQITTPSVESKMLDNNIAYIQIFTFGETTGKELHDTLVEILAKKPVGLILDLRNNGGGYLQTAVDVVSEFIPAGKTLVTEQFGNGKKTNLTTQTGGIAQNIPLVILGNENTASASEITAGAIQDFKRGKLVGTTTYGKGSVQNMIPLQNNGGAVKITIAHWLTPNGRQINKKGLTPDVEVKLSDIEIKNNIDSQLNKALELLKSPG